MCLSLSCFLCCWEVLRCVCIVRSCVSNCFVLSSTLLCLFSWLSALFLIVSVCCRLVSVVESCSLFRLFQALSVCLASSSCSKIVVRLLA